MKTYIYRGGFPIVEKSGVGKAIEHQEKMLNAVEAPRAARWKEATVVHMNTVFPDSVIAAFIAKMQKKKVIYYDTPQQVSATKKVIGKITYTYNGKEAGGAEIYYENAKNPTLNDSIDMSEWFVDAVEKANEAPFPWKKVLTIGILVVAALAITILILWWMRTHKEQRTRRNRYKREKKNRNINERGYYYHKK